LRIADCGFIGDWRFADCGFIGDWGLGIRDCGFIGGLQILTTMAVTDVEKLAAFERNSSAVPWISSRFGLATGLRLPRV
jgi:hypothetical protein